MGLTLVLPALIVLPLVGGTLAMWSARFGNTWPRWIAVAVCVAELWLSGLLWWAADFAPITPVAEPSWTHEFRVAWISRFGISFHLGVDGLALTMVALTALLGLVAVVCSWREIEDKVGLFHLNLLWHLAGVFGVFLALDLFLFFVLWEVMLVPMYFLIALWGHRGGQRDCVYAAMKFFIYTQASGLLMLVAILALVWQQHAVSGTWSFDYADLLGAGLSATAGMLIMLGFFVAFAVKLPMLPFHAWLPDAHSQAPTAGSVILAGVLLKTGAYGLLRFAVPLFPDASQQFAPFAMWLGVAGILYGASLAIVQTDLKRLVAYTSISHMGFVLLGVYAGNLTALQGVFVQMVAHGLSTGALFVLCGALYERLHTRDLTRLGGLASTMPRYATALTFFCMASLGLPATGNFIGELLVLVGSWRVAPWPTLVAASGLVVAVVYSVHIVQHVLHGTARSDATPADLDGRERATLGVLMILLLGVGLFPQRLLDTAAASLTIIASIYDGAAVR